MTHTATPWRYSPENGSPTTGRHMIAGAAPGYLAEVRAYKSDAQAKEDSDFIVRACNAHEDLVESATKFNEIMEPFTSLPPFEAMARFKELCASGDIDMLFFELARAAKVSKSALDKATR